MAIRHHAFGFTPEVYLATLRRACLVNGKLRPESLQAHADAIVQNADAATQKILEYFRYDDEWLHPPGEIPAWTEWLEISLIPHLRELPSLSHREPHSYFVLDRILPALGWEKLDIDLLIRGSNLESLPSRSGDLQFDPWFQHSHWHSGWMEPASVIRLGQALGKLEQCSRNPGPAQMAALLDWQVKSIADQEKAIRNAFLDGAEMLQTAREEKLALLLLFE